MTYLMQIFKKGPIKQNINNQGALTLLSQSWNRPPNIPWINNSTRQPQSVPSRPQLTATNIPQSEALLLICWFKWYERRYLNKKREKYLADKRRRYYQPRMTWQPADVTDTCKKRRHVEPLLALSPTAFLSFSFSLLNFRDDIFAFSCLSKSFLTFFTFRPIKTVRRRRRRKYLERN